MESLESRTMLTTVTYNDFASTAGLQLNGNAISASSKLQLTNNLNGQVGSAFATKRVPVDVGFTTDFDFQVTNGTNIPADGFTFLIQNNGAGAGALGGAGGGLGYSGLTQTVAIKFDFYSSLDQTGMYLNGALDDLGVDVRPNGIDIDGSERPAPNQFQGVVYHVTLEYDASVQDISETITDVANPANTFTQDYSVDIATALGSTDAYMGFTGATGGLNARQSILNWHLTATDTIVTPANVTATSDAPTDVHVNFTDSSNGEDGYQIERATAIGGPFVTAGTLPANITHFVDHGLTPGTNYFYRVRTVKDLVLTAPDTAVPVTTAAAFAGPVSYTDFTVTTGLTLNGSALQNGDRLLLTEAVNGEGGSAFTSEAHDIRAFTASFDFQVTLGTNPPADGFTFAIQSLGNTALGFGGGGMGISNLDPLPGNSANGGLVAIKFDFFPNLDQIGLYRDSEVIGGVPDNGINVRPFGIDLDGSEKAVPNQFQGDIFHVTLNYDGGSLKLIITNTADSSKTFTTSFALSSLPTILGANSGYVGFTGGTGGLNARQEIVNFQFASQAAPDEFGTPLAPSAVTPTCDCPHDVVINWTNNAVNQTGFKIERSNQPATGFVEIAQTAGNVTTYADHNLAAGTTYYYRVRATNNRAPGGLQDSAYSAVAPITTLLTGAPAFNYTSFPAATTTGLQLNGNAIYTVDDNIQLTSNANGETGSAFTTAKSDVTNFLTSFDFLVGEGGGNPADGFSFTIQGTSPTAIGFGGGGMGFGGLSNAVTIKFDFYPGINQTGLYLNGAVDDNGVNIPTALDIKGNSPLHVDISYDGTTLTETISDPLHPLITPFTQSYLVNIPQVVGEGCAYIGFTAATGGLNARQQILDFRFTSNPAAATAPPTAPDNVQANCDCASAVAISWQDTSTTATSFKIERSTDPVNGFVQIGQTTFTGFEDLTTSGGITYYYRVRASNGNAPVGSQDSPYSSVATVTTPVSPAPLNYSNFVDTTGLQLNGSTTVNGSNGLQLTDAANGLAGSAFSTEAHDITKFAASFDFQITNPSTPPADGFTFTIQGNGPSTLGGGGGGLGSFGIGRSVTIKFDIFPDLNQTGLYLNGAMDDGGMNVPFGMRFSGGHALHVDLKYDGTNLVETISDPTNPLVSPFSTSYGVNIPSVVGDGCAFVGFTGATGGLNAAMTILGFKFGPPATDTAAIPTAPTGVVAACDCPTSVLLNWKASSDNATGFKVERSLLPNSGFVEIGQSAVTGFLDTTAKASTTYFYRVRATNSNAPVASQDSPYSLIVSILTPAANAPISVTTFPDAPTGLQLNGSAIIPAGSGELQLTQAVNGLGGTAFFTDKQEINNFKAAFDFQIGTQTTPPADGFAFVIQGVSATALGEAGGGMGFTEIPYSAAIKFDIYPNLNQTGLYLNQTGGVPDNGIDVPTTLNFSGGGTLHVVLTYDGTTLTETISDPSNPATAPFVATYVVNLPAVIGDNCAYVGFAGGTGGLNAEQNILSFSFKPNTVIPDSPIVVNGTAGADTIYVKDVGTDVKVWVNHNPATDPADFTQPIAVTTEIDINADGADAITLDYSGGNLPGPINIDGKTGADTLTFVGNVPGRVGNSAGTGALNINGGTINVTSDVNGLDVTVNSASTINFGSSQHVKSLTLKDTSKASLTPDGTHFIRTTGGSIAAGASLDLTNNDLIFQADAASRDAVLAALSNYIKTGRNNGFWTGVGGITSSTAAAQANHLTGLPIALNDKGAGTPLYATFDGVAVDTNSILVKYSWNGDADLSGKIDSDDYFQIDNGFVLKLTKYRNGDFDFNGVVDASDYFLIDNAFISQTSVLSSAPTAAKSAKSASKSRHHKHKK